MSINAGCGRYTRQLLRKRLFAPIISEHEPTSNLRNQIFHVRSAPAGRGYRSLPGFVQSSTQDPGYRLRLYECKRPRMAPTAKPDLEKQYMSTKPPPKKQHVEPRPSSSILLISPSNEILLLSRVKTSSSFASAHVFPGGNLSASQDGDIPPPDHAARHIDGPAYRLGAIRECFEESGLLLAKKKGDESGVLLEVGEAERERARKEIHGGKLKFVDWVEELGGVVDSDSLLPFTRWITPPNLPKRFTTQMYIYFLPLTQPSVSSTSSIPIPTHDGGIEHTTASFAPFTKWLTLANTNEIILFPPQYYLMTLLAPLLTPSSSHSELQAQRHSVLKFLEGDGDGKGVRWADKVMSPTGLFMRKSDGRSVLALDKPGPELAGSGRRGDEERVVLVKFSKEGPRNVEVRLRRDVLSEERGAKI
ncbi:hypothetical protein GLAREA_08302 [Glarea lozoyensis ATCC 20868]|uniref:Nudix n=1 Tax=Glarea lozoyensis (strain ATCC 20868 / MF5171) TaxID=1116229 RepID=S3CEL6_GLAL2|nr:uncharacterized protein GLAREA_08302 [Glarea lozoyensis ATCC 20868]EPE24450.1 hypothetical protein GLAREA_08302 [Glarea lozoyensis ATCC 20868]